MLYHFDEVNVVKKQDPKRNAQAMCLWNIGQALQERNDIERRKLELAIVKFNLTQNQHNQFAW